MRSQYENLNGILLDIQKAQLGITDVQSNYREHLLGSSRVKSMALAKELLERIKEILGEEIQKAILNK